MKDLLQVATRGGSGSAARALGSGLAGMRTGTRRLLVMGVVVALFLYLGWDLFSGISRPPTTAPSMATEAQRAGETAPIAPAALPTTSPTPGEAPTSSLTGYAISLSELSGLTESTAPGTIVDLWVTWDPPLTPRPKLQRIVSGAVVDEIAPPVTPDGPYAAMLLVRQRDIEDLLWADRYGSLSAVTKPST